MKFPKDWNTLMMKSVNSLMKFPKDQNITYQINGEYEKVGQWIVTDEISQILVEFPMNLYGNYENVAIPNDS